jgi:hypothetical protein
MLLHKECTYPKHSLHCSPYLQTPGLQFFSPEADGDHDLVHVAKLAGPVVSYAASIPSCTVAVGTAT